MANEVKETGAEVTDQVAETNGTATPEKPAVDIDKILEEKLGARLEEERRKWQSNIDKILAEKTAVVNEKLTVEQRMEKMEQDARNKEIQWARKETRALAGLDEEVHNALLDYASEDTGRMKQGAEKIKGLFATKEEAYKKKIDELEKNLKYGTDAPPDSQTAAFDMESSMPKFL
jgi:hypothetical protein